MEIFEKPSIMDMAIFLTCLVISIFLSNDLVALSNVIVVILAFSFLGKWWKIIDYKTISYLIVFLFISMILLSLSFKVGSLWDMSFNFIWSINNTIVVIKSFLMFYIFYVFFRLYKTYHILGLLRSLGLPKTLLEIMVIFCLVLKSIFEEALRVYYALELKNGFRGMRNIIYSTGIYVGTTFSKSFLSIRDIVASSELRGIVEFIILIEPTEKKVSCLAYRMVGFMVFFAVVFGVYFK